MDTFDHLTLQQRIYYKVRDLIESGALQPGTQLDERRLAQELAVSRTPLREAIATLAEEGLVEARPYRRNFVRVLTSQQVNDLYVVRKTLEGLAIRLAIARITEQDIATLRLILDETQRALESGDLRAYSVADLRFHEAIAHLSGNEFLIAMLARMKRQIQLVRLRANQHPQVVERTSLERPRIMAALEALDAERAAQLMEEHIEGVRRHMMAQLAEMEGNTHAQG